MGIKAAKLGVNRLKLGIKEAKLGISRPELGVKIFPPKSSRPTPSPKNKWMLFAGEKRKTTLVNIPLLAGALLAKGQKAIRPLQIHYVTVYGRGVIMKKDLKSLVGLIMGAILGYFIIRVIFGDDESVMQTTIGVAFGMVITYAVIIGIKKASGKYGSEK
ncbi:hypothetical protein [Planomicrobium okeanokoites]|uniref:hypothetical protein n=1 Tax=Planomicrobium okeanokoites TaxID=244 RepID=UPI0015C46125|nr:hypothetical protein [Planomicrobium okeanokoites]